MSIQSSPIDFQTCFSTGMNPFDILIIVILVYCLVRGLFRGLVKELASIMGVLGGFYAAYTYYPLVARLLARLISDPAYLNIASFLAIFGSVIIVVSILGIIIKYLLSIAFMGWVDRCFGLGFGFLKSVLIIAVLFIALTTFLPAGSPFIKESLLAPRVVWVSEKMAKVVPKGMKRDFGAKLEVFKKAWKIPN
ncbi:MAG: CvpA family protein [Desulfobacterales bacterium]|nr:MAG: CvpA family protein [Desulfobacterales bacterium]